MDENLQFDDVKRSFGSILEQNLILKEMNSVVYKIYGLSDNDINIIEKTE